METLTNIAIWGSVMFDIISFLLGIVAGITLAFFVGLIFYDGGKHGSFDGK